MANPGNHERQAPLPADWLPDAAPSEGTAEWDSLAGRILRAAGPVLDPLAAGPHETDTSWPTLLASWWRPAMALAAAAAIALIATDRIQSRESAASVPLAVLVSEGEPYALWQSVGIEADPVLALIALQGDAQ